MYIFKFNKPEIAFSMRNYFPKTVVLWAIFTLIFLHNAVNSDAQNSPSNHQM